MEKLYNLAYISRNSIIASEHEVALEIKEILNSATKNNPKLGVTGALLYSGGYFCQVIEGPQDVLEELFETIQMDSRHKDVKVLHFEEIVQRGFGEWAMAFAGVDDSMKKEIEGVLHSKDTIKMQDAGRHLISTLENMVATHQRVLKSQP